MDSKYEYYRYYNLFKNFLRVKLHREHGSFIPVLLDKAGNWYAANQQMIKAITYYIDAGSYEKGISLIESVSGTLLWKGQVSKLLELNSRLAKHLVNNNLRLLLNGAWGSLAKGEINKISEYLNMTEVFLKQQHRKDILLMDV